ncbi:hypothetical protein Tco_0676375 [Tanacetum coccineum]
MLAVSQLESIPQETLDLAAAKMTVEESRRPHLRTKYKSSQQELSRSVRTDNELNLLQDSVMSNMKALETFPKDIARGLPTAERVLPVVAVDQSAGQADQAVDQPPPSEPLPSSSHPLVLSATTKSEPTLVAEQITHPTSLTPELDRRNTDYHEEKGNL